MSDKKKGLDKEQINKEVREFYDKIAKGKMKVREDSKALGRALGYTEEELASVPEEANLGLGCGNPQEKAKPKEGESVLDLGCGKGMDVFIAAKKVGETGFVAGVDSNEEMVKKARYIAKKRKFPQTKFYLGPIEDLPIESDSFDLVISNCVINLSTEKQKVYDEIYRVLKPGGRIGISDIICKEELPDEILNDPKMYGT